MNIVIIGVTSLVFTVIAMLTVDRLGRRRLFLGGLAGLAVIFLVLGWSYYSARSRVCRSWPWRSPPSLAMPGRWRR